MRVSSILFSMAFGLFAALLLTIFSAGALGETIEIEFIGLDLEYDGTDVYDAGGPAAFRDTDDAGDADPLTIVSFTKDDVLKGYDSGYYVDVLIKDVFNIPAGGLGGAASSTGNSDDFGFDIFDPVNDWSLRLNINDFGVAYARHPLIGDLAIVVTGAVSSIEGQNLPHDLSIGTPVTIVVSSANFTVESAGGFLTKFKSSGTGSIVAVPEPSTLAGLLMAALAIVACTCVRRRR